MRNSLRISALAVATLAALSFASNSYGWDLFGVLGIGGGSGCGDCCEAGCGCESGCGCEASCGCEPSCGCGCGCDGRQFGGQTWNCCNDSPPPICPCTDCGGCACGVDTSTCGCGSDCCEASCGCGEATCGCGCGDGCEPACGCGCGDSCGCGPAYGGCGFGSCCGRLLGMIDRCCCGCGGCDSEMYWSEWHNDPPCCHDPCDCYGNWTGGGGGCGGRFCNGDRGFCEPYEHAYCPTCSNGHGPSRGYANGGHYAGRPAASPAYVARNAAPNMRGAAPAAPTQVARRPVPAYVTRTAAPTKAQVARSAAPAPASRISANPNPWRGAQRATTQPVPTTRPMTTRGQLTRKPEPPVYNTFQR